MNFLRFKLATSSFYLRVLVVFVFAITGCGYSFQGGGSVLPQEVKTVYIPESSNRSSEPKLTRLLTEALRERFERYGVIRITEDVSESDATLESEIIQVRSKSSTSNAVNDTAQQLSTTLFVSGILRQNNGVVLWSNPSVSVTQTFGNVSNAVVTSSSNFAQSGLTSADINNLSQRELTRSQESQAFELLAEQVAKQIYDEAVAPDF